MSQIITFSADKSFANDLDNIIQKSGYQNRSRFIRDASLFYSEIQQRGELNNMKDEEIVEGHLIIYYQHQHGVENKLMDIRHSHELEISSYNHSCLKHSHTCVDIIQGKGTASDFRKILEQLQNTPNVNKISFISAPMRQEGCC
jgi:metal-responsive CopG/Arc/MetJ family transcriptional regulator|tara:strand:+ start:703 stop:1134 length:432 start_codon:yes stop_codon:yes gene_type:complete